MKLSKAESIALIVFILAVILGGGGFFFVYPQITAIQTNTSALNAANQQLAEINTTLEREGTIDDEINAAYDAGKELSSSFYSDMNAYETDYAVREFLKGAKLSSDSLAISNFSTGELSLSFFTPSEVSYPLKEYSKSEISLTPPATNTEGDAAAESTTATDAAVPEETPVEEPSATEGKYTDEEMQEYLSGSQQIGCVSVTFTVKTTVKELKELMDYINNYEKATYLTTISVPYTVSSETASEDGSTVSSNSKVKDSTEVSTTMTLILYCVDPMQKPNFDAVENGAADTETQSDAA